MFFSPYPEIFLPFLPTEGMFLHYIYEGLGGIYKCKGMFCLKKSKRGASDQEMVRGWSKQYKRPVSMEDVHEINTNLESFVNVMERIELYLNEKVKKKNSIQDKAA